MDLLCYLLNFVNVNTTFFSFLKFFYLVIVKHYFYLKSKKKKIVNINIGILIQIA